MVTTYTGLRLLQQWIFAYAYEQFRLGGLYRGLRIDFVVRLHERLFVLSCLDVYFAIGSRSCRRGQAHGRTKTHG